MQKQEIQEINDYFLKRAISLQEDVETAAEEANGGTGEEGSE